MSYRKLDFPLKLLFAFKGNVYYRCAHPLGTEPVLRYSLGKLKTFLSQARIEFLAALGSLMSPLFLLMREQHTCFAQTALSIGLQLFIMQPTPHCGVQK